MDSDQLLVRRAIDGDERAMRMLWTRHTSHVDAVVRRLVGDPDAAADVAQDVWIQIFRALPSWRGDSQFGTWIHRVAVNRTLNALRRMRRTGRFETSLDEATDEQPAGGVSAAMAVEPDSDRALLAATIEEAARRLSPGARQVFMLHDVEGYTHEEIAESLGITAGGSKSQLFKARAKLRRLLAHLVDGTGGRESPVRGSPTNEPSTSHGRSAAPASSQTIRHHFAPHAAPGY
jgi:RNA polymerase sigma-70 factor (ECF subfamily)